MWESLHVERTVLRTMTYVLLVMAAVFMAFINLIYGVTFTRTQNYDWLTSVSVGIVTGNRVAPHQETAMLDCFSDFTYIGQR